MFTARSFGKVGVEAYAAYALRAWLARENWIGDQTRRFAKWSAICSFALGMAGQVAYHLLAQAGTARAPWPITTIVSCLPVLVLAMGTALAHMLRADAAADARDNAVAGPATAWSLDRSAGDRHAPGQHRTVGGGSGPPASIRKPAIREPDVDMGTTSPGSRDTPPRIDQARLVARTLAAAGKSASRRALRDAGVKGSNESLNALARWVNAELAGGKKSP